MRERERENRFRDCDFIKEDLKADLPIPPRLDLPTSANIDERDARIFADRRYLAGRAASRAVNDLHFVAEGLRGNPRYLYRPF